MKVTKRGSPPKAVTLKTWSSARKHLQGEVLRIHSVFVSQNVMNAFSALLETEDNEDAELTQVAIAALLDYVKVNGKSIFTQFSHWLQENR